MIKDHLGRKVGLKIEYEWKPLYCDKCSSIRHDCAMKVHKRIRHPPIQDNHYRKRNLRKLLLR
ncbi:hypothetical protein TanjilG_31253 [Lupinus angustifolius]|uniref:Uncharacterized protein n=1 Tax=Lupinus angustifolius TaxID=3871 RepID=A0A1J7HVL4_LUPAN|nr:hypothetical protein TanjilG_31253 [Lupinus angustifolius]